MCKDCKKEPYYITTAIAYASGKPHIGNTYEAVLADAIARFKRAEGYDVFFQTGTDEHGQKIEEKAAAAGVTPQEFVDQAAGQIKTIWDLMNTSYDKFIRTTDKDHEAQVQKIFKKLYDQGDIYKGYYEGLYCTPCESFFTESQLVDGKCPDCGREVKPAKEEAYFFRMSKYADRLINHINEHPEFIQPVSRKNEMMNNFLLPGLQDLCVSRTTFSWGIPEFSIPGMIYGAAFSWNTQIPDFEEINRQISEMEYGDSTGRLVGVLAKTQALNGFTWETAVRFKELKTGAAPEYEEDHRQYIQGHMEALEGVDDKNRRLEEVTGELYGLLPHMDSRNRPAVKAFVIAAEGIGLFNELGKIIAERDYGLKYGEKPDSWELAERLEVWLYHYKELYRSVSRESELGRIQEIVVWYGDYLREQR